MNEIRSSRKHLCLLLCIIAISFIWLAVNTDKAGAEEKATQKISGEFDRSMVIAGVEGSSQTLTHLDLKAETKMVYESSNEDIAEVSDTGIVGVKRPGAVAIYVTALENERYKKAEAVVTVIATASNENLYPASKGCEFGYWGGDSGSSIVWNLDNSGTLNIDGRGKLNNVMDNGMFDSPVKKVIIGNRITGIDRSCFTFYSELENVSIPSSVMSIGKNAFSHCSNLKSVTIPGSVKIIDKETFAYCDGLRKVTICDGVSEIRDSAFYESPVKYVTIPVSVKKITGLPFNMDGSMTIYGYSGTQAEKYSMGQYEKKYGYIVPCTRFYDLKKKTYKLYKVYVSKEMPSYYKTINLCFDQPSATYYELYRASSKKGKYKKIKEVKGDYFKDKNRSFNKKYYYKVRACLKVSGKKYYSSFTSFTAKSKLPGPSYSLKTKVKSGKRGNMLKWKKVPGATGYRIYTYDKKKKKNVLLADKSGKARIYIHQNVKKGKQYEYTIRAYRKIKGKKILGVPSRPGYIRDGIIGFNP